MTAREVLINVLYMQIAVAGSWMSKIEGLLRRLVYQCQTEPDVKHLVRRCQTAHAGHLQQCSSTRSPRTR